MRRPTDLPLIAAAAAPAPATAAQAAAQRQAAQQQPPAQGGTQGADRSRTQGMDHSREGAGAGHQQGQMRQRMPGTPGDQHRAQQPRN